jgi:hypothetical protein
MIALVVLGVTLLWGFLGVWVWWRFLNRRLSSPLMRISALILFMTVWLVAPALDEILGAREFEQLCREMPEKKFYGPVPVGPGPYFDRNGAPKWENDRDFSLIRLDPKGRKAWDEVISWINDDWRLLTHWPMPIGELHTVIVDRRNDKPVAEAYARYSPGGWIKRGLGWGNHAVYQCPSKGQWPHDATWIYFDATSINSNGSAQ